MKADPNPVAQRLGLMAMAASLLGVYPLLAGYWFTFGLCIGLGQGCIWSAVTLTRYARKHNIDMRGQSVPEATAARSA